MELLLPIDAAKLARHKKKSFYLMARTKTERQTKRPDWCKLVANLLDVLAQQELHNLRRSNTRFFFENQ
jgi:hypothetical protein